jgi:hypothetical protein
MSPTTGPDCTSATAAGNVEICNGIDDNCNGAIDERLGNTECGTGPCATSVPACVKGIPQSCTPKPAPSSYEICGNGIDDNCNGQVDENCQPACTSNWVWSAWSACSSGVQTRTTSDANNCPTSIGRPADQTQTCNATCTPVTQTCSVGVGACARSGTQTQSCVNGVLGALSVCSATAGAPAAETCGNHVDDNCNGQVDEGCLFQNGQPCQVSSQCYSQNCANGICASYQDCITSCTSLAQNCVSYSCGWFGWSTCQQCTPYQNLNTACAQGCNQPCTPVSQPCSVGVGACARSGTQTQSCVNGVLGAPGACSATPGTPIAEICGNAIDDNCDGQIDEGCSTPPCTQGTTTCGLGACQNTIQNCINGVPQTCTPGPTYPSPEICSNGIDENCNGQIDEGCLFQNGHSCQVSSQCYSQNCANGICGSYQECINSCTSLAQNCVSYSCGWFGWSTCQQCNSYPSLNQACALSCNP